MKKILFVCLGNICRSSSAEGVMKHLVEEAGRADEFLIDSAGILSYHQGELPDSRMRAHAARRGYNLTHLSRPVRTEDFYNFDLIIGMDDRNIDDLKDRAPSTAEWSKIHRMTEYCTKFTHADHVPDPGTSHRNHRKIKEIIFLIINHLSISYFLYFCHILPIFRYSVHF